MDATTFDLGREVDILVEASSRSGMHIVAATGLWLAPSPALTVRTTDQIADWFTADIAEGLDGTNVRAGIIKVASELELKPFEERVLEAAARAHPATGAPILTHSLARNRMGEQQAAVLERYGVDPSRVVIGHSDDAYGHRLPRDARRPWLSHRHGPAAQRQPAGIRHPGRGGRLDMIAALVARGYAEHLVLSHDDPVWAGVLSDVDQARHLASTRMSSRSSLGSCCPAFASRGVPEAAITLMTTSNPQRWLSGAA